MECFSLFFKKGMPEKRDTARGGAEPSLGGLGEGGLEDRKHVYLKF